MALILKDRVRETSSSSGTGNITLGGAISGYQTFNAVIASGSTVYYTIHNLTAGFESEFEVGVGTFTSPATLARNTVLSSSNSGSSVNFTAGVSGLEVFITQPAGEAVYINQATGKVEAFGNGTNTISFVAVTSDLFTGDGSAISSINASNVSSGTIANARTTASSSNGASTIVLRGASGEFAAGAITGSSFSGDGSAITAINAASISTGTVATARLGSGTANSATFLRGDSTFAVVSSGTLIPAGTVMLFAQTAAPTGFTKNTTTGDNSALRVTTGTASSGGSVAFTTAFTSQAVTGSVATTNTAQTATNQAQTATNIAVTATNQAITPAGSVSITSVAGSAGATTLTTPQIPSHTHTVQIFNNPEASGGATAAGQSPLSTFDTGATGGGGSHTHPFSFSSGSGTFSGNSVTALQNSHNHTQNSHNHTQDAHNHTASSSFTGNAINLAVQYIDVIRATKD